MSKTLPINMDQKKIINQGPIIFAEPTFSINPELGQRSLTVFFNRLFFQEVLSSQQN